MVTCSLETLARSIFPALPPACRLSPASHTHYSLEQHYDPAHFPDLSVLAHFSVLGSCTSCWPGYPVLSLQMSSALFQSHWVSCSSNGLSTVEFLPCTFCSLPVSGLDLYDWLLLTTGSQVKNCLPRRLPLVTLAKDAAFISTLISLTDTLVKFLFTIFNIRKFMAYLSFIMSAPPMVRSLLRAGTKSGF